MTEYLSAQHLPSNTARMKTAEHPKRQLAYKADGTVVPAATNTDVMNRQRHPVCYRQISLHPRTGPPAEYIVYH